MHLHYEAPESRTCSGCSHYGVNLETGAPPNKLGIPTGEAFFNRIFDTLASIRLSYSAQVATQPALASPRFEYALVGTCQIATCLVQ
jgi:hypothetical protein